jgi:hypothetical protein
LFQYAFGIKCQGYETFAIRNDIVNEKMNVPEIWYYDNNKKYRYFVDIYIPSQNKCIEVKTNLLKQEAAKKLGYNFEFWIYDNKGNRVNIHDTITSH